MRAPAWETAPLRSRLGLDARGSDWSRTRKQGVSQCASELPKRTKIPGLEMRNVAQM
jgi:hypothetical protein